MSKNHSDALVFDYVIVGAGSAGCVLAHRLSADPDCRVLLLEAGGADRFWHWQVRMPAALSYPMNGTRFSWDYHSEPEPHLGGRRMHCPRGRVLGGSSSINGMVCIRGHARDYDRWAHEDAALATWDYRHCLPYFIRSESWEGGRNDYHGDTGPLRITRGGRDHPLAAAFLDAAVEAGYSYTEDMNGYRQEGFGPMDRTTYDGIRESTSRAYLRPARRRPNRTVMTRAHARRLHISGRRIDSIEFLHRGNEKKAHAERCFVLAGGPINNPQLLMLSGIGPADHLRESGVAVQHDLPGVGENLQDHLEIYLQMACTQPVSLFRYYNLAGKALTGAQWLLTRTGLGSSNHFEAGGFIRSRAGVEHPDLQYHFFPMAVRYDGKSPNDSHGFQAHIGPMRSQSKGTVRLRSANPADKPRICFNYMSKAEDWEEFRAAVRLTRELFEQDAFRPYRGEELSPGAAVQSDAEIDAFVRDAVETAYHPSCTCKMGGGDDAVVDESCRVRDLENLCIADSSIMPSIVSGNLNAPTIMLAEKAADLIAGKMTLPPADVPVYAPPDYRDSQR